ncbi:A/G-specific DNA-adenine glycosylase [Chitinophaga costaii]|uniref:Adenine DNA glycosylase n=1 Tax=Chitinophaga costaii TaxID=1335309 RepID=A0A1C4FRI8_9BACT|nr:A/G-specific adenine glycosylase [Chitinophaga costaii]PUZ20493.1 A/G-specific adenine glycosylase [Chitinophaga costaii]SCC58570.1 A/G-specific DNA-adenine glycosylase [Chitinophaga costaii]
MKRAGKAFFTENLLIWNSEINTRNMPWKGEKDPYRIWLSEIILQQTRVEQGWPYYERFIKAYPTVNHLARASDDEVFRHWQGLGYYNRCRNMLAAARTISKDYQGQFPHTYESILALKGVGAYTAAAIASFAYGLPHAVVDGNVYRVLARYFGIQTPTDTTEGKKEFTLLAGELLDKTQSAAYNQAIMDFGAVVCKPQQPACSSCPLSTQCLAYQTGRVEQLPLKTKKIMIRQRFFYYIILIYNKQVYIRKRKEKDIWQNLHEFILLEQPCPVTQAELLASEGYRAALPGVSFKVEGLSAPYKQQLTHQTIIAQFLTLRGKGRAPALEGYQLVPQSMLNDYAFPKTITSYLEKSALGLTLF